jgi:2-polyprenyl-3-methyl-5-hydroxy-6-metoxy-1,4-benzoquinol methylase
MAETKFRAQLEPYYAPSAAIRLHRVEACNLCAGREFATWKRIGPWTIAKCAQCGLCFLNPRPDAGEMYADYHRRLHIEDAPSAQAVQRGIAAWEERAEWICALQGWDEGRGTGDAGLPRPTPHAPRPALRALDLGCASGFFLANLKKRGWDVMGIELADWAAQRARELFGIPVVTSDILKADLPNQAFDLVTLWDVIEHVPDPAAVLAKAKLAAKPDGLIVLRVPNAASLDARVLGVRWIDWCLPYHFYHFTPMTLAGLAERGGLRACHVETGVSTRLWEFLLVPLRGLASLRVSQFARSLAHPLTRSLAPLYRSFGARYMPGPTITLVAQPV